MLQDVKSYLGRSFAMKDLGDAAYILGIKIYRDRSKRLIGLNQSAYIEKILKRFYMENSKRGTIPMQEKLKLSNLKRQLRVSCYTDAGYLTDADNLKSQTGYVFVLNGGAVDWKSTKQSIFATSSTDAEYIAAFDASKEAVMDSKFISGLGIVPTIEEPISMYCDNTGAIAIAKDDGVTKGPIRCALMAKLVVVLMSKTVMGIGGGLEQLDIKCFFRKKLRCTDSAKMIGVLKLQFAVVDTNDSYACHDLNTSLEEGLYTYLSGKKVNTTVALERKKREAEKGQIRAELRARKATEQKEKLGYDIDGNELNDLFWRLKSVAEMKKVITDDDLVALVSDEVFQTQIFWKFGIGTDTPYFLVGIRVMGCQNQFLHISSFKLQNAYLLANLRQVSKGRKNMVLLGKKMKAA
ncbi:retrotransposon protein, putative, ty1-copia subclass [Tanacetum coccineum]